MPKIIELEYRILTLNLLQGCNTNVLGTFSFNLILHKIFALNKESWTCHKVKIEKIKQGFLVELNSVNGKLMRLITINHVGICCTSEWYFLGYYTVGEYKAKKFLRIFSFI